MISKLVFSKLSHAAFRIFRQDEKGGMLGRILNQAEVSMSLAHLTPR
jgi:hypothetical protein